MDMNHHDHGAKSKHVSGMEKPVGRSLLWVAFLASIPAFTAHAPKPFPLEAKTCDTRFQQIYLNGSFQLPNAGGKMNLLLGKENYSKKPVTVMLADSKTQSCQAVCNVVGFERYQHDFHPASLQLECKGVGLSELRTPAFLQWAKFRGDKSYHAVIRVGSGLFQVQEAKLNILKDEYTPMKVQQWTKRKKELAKN